MTTKADEALAKAKKEAEEVQTSAAMDAVNPPNPAAKVEKTPPVAPKAAVVAPKVPAKASKQSIVQIIFNEGIRDVEIKFIKDEQTMSPRKIEHALGMLKKKYREHLGAFQAAEARKQRAAEEAASKK